MQLGVVAGAVQEHLAPRLEPVEDDLRAEPAGAEAAPELREGDLQRRAGRRGKAEPLLRVGSQAECGARLRV